MTRTLRAALAAFAIAASIAGAQNPGGTPAARPVAATARDTKPLAAGDAVPDLAPLKAADGTEVDLDAVPAGETRVLVFYRGGWCPYCMAHLADVARIQPTLAKGGVTVYAISPDTPEHLSKTAGERKLP
jgi:cytochrome oxidase Cu insertion factor (SCO1/SenC/PrrC family)